MPQYTQEDIERMYEMIGRGQLQKDITKPQPIEWGLPPTAWQPPIVETIPMRRAFPPTSEQHLGRVWQPSSISYGVPPIIPTTTSPPPVATRGVPPIATEERPSAIPEEADMYVKRDKKGNIIAAQDRPGKGFKAWKTAYPEHRIGGFTFYGKDFQTPREGIPPSAASIKAWEAAGKLTAPYRELPSKMAGMDVDFGLMGYTPPPQALPVSGTASPDEIKQQRINQISMEVIKWGREHEPSRPFMQEELEYRLRQEGLFPYYQKLTAKPTPPPGIEDIAALFIPEYGPMGEVTGKRFASELYEPFRKKYGWPEIATKPQLTPEQALMLLKQRGLI